MIRARKENFDFIEANAAADTARLRLRHHGDAEVAWMAMQIDCRRRAVQKLQSTLSCREFVFPTELSAQQCTSDALAELHAELVGEGERVVDLTAGLGIDAFHIARRAASVTAIDINTEVAEALAYNARALGIGNLTAECADAVVWAEVTSERFDTIFIDPARRGSHGERLFALAQCLPDVTAMLPALRRIGKRLIVKASPMLDVSHTIQELPGVTDVYCYGTATECKELTAVVDLHRDLHREEEREGEPTVHAVTPGHPSLSFRRSEEAAATAHYGVPQPGMTLHEPLPAVMKSGAFNLLCERFGLTKISRDSHLYFAEGDVVEAPTRRYRVETVYDFSKRGVAECRRAYQQANVAARGFVISAAELAKKLGVKNGGTKHIFGVTDAGGTRRLIACSE